MPERRRAEIVALVQLINAQLWIGHFDIWTRDDIVMFRHAHCLAGGAQPSDVQCRTIVEAALSACENYFQAFQFVLWAGRSAREAMDFAVFETKGTAWRRPGRRDNSVERDSDFRPLGAEACATGGWRCIVVYYKT